MKDKVIKKVPMKKESTTSRVEHLEEILENVSESSQTISTSKRGESRMQNTGSEDIGFSIMSREDQITFNNSKDKKMKY